MEPTPLITIISPSIGDWIIIRMLNKQVDAILYDPTSKLPERNPSWIKILGWPYTQAFPSLTFTEFVSNPDTAANEIITSDKSPDKGKKKYISIRKFANSGLAIGTRSERVKTIKQIENHPAVVESITSDGISLETAINITVEFLNPLPGLKIDEPLIYVANFVIEAYRLWSAKNDFKENRKVCTTEDNKRIPDEIWDKIEKLNKENFEPQEFVVRHISVVLIAVATASLGALRSEEQILIESNNNERSKHTKEIELRENEVQAKRNETRLKLLNGEAAIQIKIVTKTSDGIAKQNAAWGSSGLKSLVLNGGNSPQAQIQSIQVADATGS